MRRVRWLLCGLAVIGMAPQTRAADMPFLRGSNTIVAPQCCIVWDGFYFGGQVGATVSGADFSAANVALNGLLGQIPIQNVPSVTAWQPLGQADTSATHFGGFVGYNWQWDQAVVSIEGNYNRTDFGVASTGILFSGTDTLNNTVQVSGTVATRVTDYGTVRVRGGWAVGSFMPYMTLGLAVGRADVTRSVTVTTRDPTTTAILSQAFASEAKAGTVAYGYAAGFGLDMALMQNVFVRAEYEYLQFGPFHDVNLHIHNARVGAGIKF